MIKDLLRQSSHEFCEEQLEKFSLYFDLLAEQNKTMNLTAITEPQGVAQKHFLDSLLPLDFGLIPQNARCIDVGTGAGFPGIPLLIARPDLSMVLLDSLNKRVIFLRRVLQELEISAEAIHSRAEDAARQKEHREQYDIALSRAVAPLNVIAELTLPFVKTGGMSVCYKGPGVHEELLACDRALTLLTAEATLLEAPRPWGDRTLAALKKTGPIPAAYPRKAGLPSKAPL